jgi:hypothetical protein
VLIRIEIFTVPMPIGNLSPSACLVTTNQIFSLLYEPSSGFCSVIVAGNNMALSAAPYVQGNKTVIKLIQDSPNPDALEQQWSFVYAPNFGAGMYHTSNNVFYRNSCKSTRCGIV